MHTISTIGYQATTIPCLLDTLQDDGVELLVDIRAVASSRRPGFSKSKLAANLQEGGIGYLHLRGLGTPAEGRQASHEGRYADMREIYQQHLATAAAQDELETLAELVRSGRRVCLLCFEADHQHCHRSLVVEALQERLPLQVTHLTPGVGATGPEPTT